MRNLVHVIDWTSFSGVPMTTLFDQAIYAVASLPREEQDTIAREILERIAVNARWKTEFANPLHDDWLARLSSDSPETRHITSRHDPDTTTAR